MHPGNGKMPPTCHAGGGMDIIISVISQKRRPLGAFSLAGFRRRSFLLKSAERTADFLFAAYSAETYLCRVARTAPTPAVSSVK